MTGFKTVFCYAIAAAVFFACGSSSIARDAAFLDPGSGGGGGGTEVEDIRADPKADVDIGETNIHSAKRQTLFFANVSAMPVKVEKLAVNSDANVTADITNDDCTKQGTIAPQSKCSVEINITPTGAGAWTVEVLLTHNGAGRIARERISGKTSGGPVDDRKETGLDMLSKEPAPINFGDVEADSKTAHSALMVNDSADPISIYSIDVIEADNGLKILDGGCEADMVLKPGESCPVTLVWQPQHAGEIATDLIIRHNGRQGFAVIPVRGKTKGETAAPKSEASTANETKRGKELIPPPLGANELDAAARGRVPQVELSSLETARLTPIPTAALRLIGTVGNRGVLLLPDGSTKIVVAGDSFTLGSGEMAKVSEIDAKSVTLLIDGKKKVLILGTSPELVAHATAIEQASQIDQKSKKDKNAAQAKTPGTTALGGVPLMPGVSGNAFANNPSGGISP